MTIKIVLLKTGENIICDAKEIISNENVCGYLLGKPHKVLLERPVLLTENVEECADTISITLTPWIPLTDDEQVPVFPSSVITLVEPIKTIKEMYLEKVGKSND